MSEFAHILSKDEILKILKESSQQNLKHRLQKEILKCVQQDEEQINEEIIRSAKNGNLSCQIISSCVLFDFPFEKDKIDALQHEYLHAWKRLLESKGYRVQITCVILPTIHIFWDDVVHETSFTGLLDYFVNKLKE